MTFAENDPEQRPRILGERPTAAMEERAILGTAQGLIEERFPGTERRSLEEVLDVVRRVHAETSELVYSQRMRTADAAAYEYRRYREELADDSDDPDR
jgi:hypothetical protein